MSGFPHVALPELYWRFSQVLQRKSVGIGVSMLKFTRNPQKQQYDD
jgi:hypothetical protein